MSGPAAAVPRVLVLCTGNAARSVMAGYMLEWLAGSRGLSIEVTTAGTHVTEGQPMGMRTRHALEAIPEIAGAPVAAHRSRQLTQPAVDDATVLVAMEADHVRYVRRRHPEAASRTATLRLLSRDLPEGPAPLADRVAALELAAVQLGPHHDVEDPAGKDEAAYAACAKELWMLCRELAARL